MRASFIVLLALSCLSATQAANTCLDDITEASCTDDSKKRCPAASTVGGNTCVDACDGVACDMKYTLGSGGTCAQSTATTCGALSPAAKLCPTGAASQAGVASSNALKCVADCATDCPGYPKTSTNDCVVATNTADCVAATSSATADFCTVGGRTYCLASCDGANGCLALPKTQATTLVCANCQDTADYGGASPSLNTNDLCPIGSATAGNTCVLHGTCDDNCGPKFAKSDTNDCIATTVNECGGTTTKLCPATSTAGPVCMADCTACTGYTGEATTCTALDATAITEESCTADGNFLCPNGDANSRPSARANTCVSSCSQCTGFTTAGPTCVLSAVAGCRGSTTDFCAATTPPTCVAAGCSACAGRTSANSNVCEVTDDAAGLCAEATAGKRYCPATALNIDGTAHAKAGTCTSTASAQACAECSPYPMTPAALETDSAVDAGNDLVVFAAPHGIAANAAVVYAANGQTAIGGLTDGNVYYVLDGGVNTKMKLALTPGGSAIDISAGAADNQITAVTCAVAADAAACASSAGANVANSKFCSVTVLSGVGVWAGGIAQTYCLAADNDACDTCTTKTKRSTDTCGVLAGSDCGGNLKYCPTTSKDQAGVPSPNRGKCSTVDNAVTTCEAFCPGYPRVNSNDCATASTTQHCSDASATARVNVCTVDSLTYCLAACAGAAGCTGLPKINDADKVCSACTITGTSPSTSTQDLCPMDSTLVPNTCLTDTDCSTCGPEYQKNDAGNAKCIATTVSECAANKYFCAVTDTCADDCSACTGFPFAPTEGSTCIQGKSQCTYQATATLYCPNDGSCDATDCSGCTNYLDGPTDGVCTKTGTDAVCTSQGLEYCHPSTSCVDGCDGKCTGKNSEPAAIAVATCTGADPATKLCPQAGPTANQNTCLADCSTCGGYTKEASTCEVAPAPTPAPGSGSGTAAADGDSTTTIAAVCGAIGGVILLVTAVYCMKKKR